MKLYVAGPMRGIEAFNFPAFDYAADTLRVRGYEVCNPAAHDRETYGAEINPDNADDMGFDLRSALAFDLDWIACNADGIAVLPGWEKSAGARAEVALAHALGLPVARWTVWHAGRRPYFSDDLIAPPLYQSGIVTLDTEHYVTATDLVTGFTFDLGPARKTGETTDGDTATVTYEFGAYDDMPQPPIYTVGGTPDDPTKLVSNFDLRGTDEQRAVSSTGGEKGTKPQRYDLIPRYPLDVVAEHFGRGASKYADHNWRRGYEWSHSFAAMMRHAWAWWDGEENDADGWPHQAAIAFHALVLIQFARDFPQFDDRYKVGSNDSSN